MQPLTEMQMQAVIFDLAKRSKDTPAVPSSLPPQLLLLLQLTGSNLAGPVKYAPHFKLLDQCVVLSCVPDVLA